MKKEKKNWEKEFDKIRNDGEHCSLDDEALNKFDVIMLKDIFRELFAQEKQKYRQEILGRLPKEREEVNELNPKDYESILEYARTKGYNQTLQKIKELIRKI